MRTETYKTCMADKAATAIVLTLTLAALLVLSPFPARAQDTSRNFVKTVTMLDAG